MAAEVSSALLKACHPFTNGKQCQGGEERELPSIYSSFRRRVHGVKSSAPKSLANCFAQNHRAAQCRDPKPSRTTTNQAIAPHFVLHTELLTPNLHHQSSLTLTAPRPPIKDQWTSVAHLAVLLIACMGRGARGPWPWRQGWRLVAMPSISRATQGSSRVWLS
jgi:hypothetical protein